VRPMCLLGSASAYNAALEQSLRRTGVMPYGIMPYANKKGRGVNGAETVGNGSYRQFY
jgi:hypothetical protein